VKRIAIAAVACLALLAIFAAIAVSVVNGRRPLRGELTRSFGTAVTNAVGGRASVEAPECLKVSVEFFSCSAAVTPPRRPAPVYVGYNVWLNDDGCWDTKRRSKEPQSPALGRLRPRFRALAGCLPH
jgi:hypothetical protein